MIEFESSDQKCVFACLFGFFHHSTITVKCVTFHISMSITLLLLLLLLLLLVIINECYNSVCNNSFIGIKCYLKPAILLCRNHIFYQESVLKMLKLFIFYCSIAYSLHSSFYNFFFLIFVVFCYKYCWNIENENIRLWTLRFLELRICDVIELASFYSDLLFSILFFFCWIQQLSLLYILVCLQIKPY